MPTLFILEQGVKISKTSRRLILEKNREILLDLPEFKVDKIFIFGNAQISTQAFKFMLETGKDVSFFTVRGRFMGKLVSHLSRNVFVRLKQYECFKNERLRLEFCKKTIKAKLKNCRSVLQRNARVYKDLDMEEEISRLEELIASIEKRTGISSLLGVEGMGSRIYFKGYAKLFKPEGFSFEARIKHPPLGFVNSMLSLGYALITSEMFSVLFALGMDPYVGFLHALEYSRPSLALDLIEELRPALIDRFILEIVNKKVIKPGDFEESVFAENGGNKRCLLSSQGRRVYFYHYERRMQTKVFYAEEEVNYRSLLEKKARNFIEFLKGENLMPFLIR